MGTLSDFVSKIASDALGRIIAAAPGQFVKIMTSAAWCEVTLDSSLFAVLLAYLNHVGTEVWAPATKYDHSLLGGRTVIKYSDVGFFLVEKRLVALIRRESPKSLSYHVGYLRGFDIEKLLNKALNVCPPNKSGLWVAVSKKEGEIGWQCQGTLQEMRKVWLSPAMSALDNDMAQWMSSRKFCTEAGLPWRRGWLLWGAPGNGKSSAIRNLAIKHGLNLCVLSLASLTDRELSTVWSSITHCTPCVVLVEDIDDILRGRQNIRDPQKGFTFSTLLNCLDGAAAIDGVSVAITTNDLEAIDSALGRPRDDTHWNQLSTRPGRLDRCIRFDNPDFVGRVEIGKLLLPEAEARDLAAQHDDVSLVQFQSLCRDRMFARMQGGLAAAS